MFVPSGAVENGACANSSRPCCWLKGEPGLVPTPSTIPLISAGVVAQRGLPAPVIIEERFSAEPEFATVRWTVNFSSKNASRPFGSQSLGSWLAMDAGASQSQSSYKMWVAYGSKAPLAPGGYFEPFSLPNATWTYGVRDGGTDTFGIPVAMLTRGSAGVSLSLSAEDRIVDLELTSMLSRGTGAAVGFGRQRHRLGAGVSVHSTQFIIGHGDAKGMMPADWRGLLGWYTGKHSQWFVPDPRAKALESFAGGSAQYCDLRQQNYSAEELSSFGLTLNWDASFAWDFWGNFLPQEQEFERCTCVGHQDGSSGVALPFDCFANGSRADGMSPSDPAATCEQLSLQQIASWYRRARDKGVATVLYQDPLEWGAQLVPVDVDISQSCPVSNTSVFCRANRLFRSKFEPAALAGNAGPGTLDFQPVEYITRGLLIIDALHAPYQDFIVDMAKRMVTLPVAGIAWDRSDHATALNGRLDDGIAWDAGTGNITSWLGTGWQQVVARVAEVFHGSGMAMLHNSYTNRQDFNRHMDGIYDENGDQSWRTPVDALLGLSKSVWIWDHCGQQERDHRLAACSRDASETHA